uniref:Uncharacterized protein n=1 Tax=viral metagenome TaxID=1070528 RepID=A0A6M3KBU2_9ZZZZ
MNAALQHDQIIRDKVHNLKGSLLEVAGLLAQSQMQGMWLQAVASGLKWKDYIESLGGPSYSYMTRLIRVVMAVGEGHYTATQLDEMGISNAIRLLPIIRKGGLTDEILQAALTGSPAILEAELKQDSAPKPIVYLVCSGCGEELECRRCGAKAVK